MSVEEVTTTYWACGVANCDYSCQHETRAGAEACVRANIRYHAVTQARRGLQVIAGQVQNKVMEGIQSILDSDKFLAEVRAVVEKWS